MFEKLKRSAVDALSKCLLGIAPRARRRLDFVAFDLDAPWKVDADKLKSKSKNTAIENRNLQGKILMTYLNGELVYSN